MVRTRSSSCKEQQKPPAKAKPTSSKAGDETKPKTKPKSSPTAAELATLQQLVDGKDEPTTWVYLTKTNRHVIRKLDENQKQLVIGILKLFNLDVRAEKFSNLVAKLEEVTVSVIIHLP